MINMDFSLSVVSIAQSIRWQDSPSPSDKRKPLALWVLLGLMLLTACTEPVPVDISADVQGHTAPTQATIAANKAMLDKRPFANTSDFEYANRGLIARDHDFTVTDPDGQIVFSVNDFDFISALKRLIR
jgi:alkyl sulfatase BDS1-like metallo-beta-lactamase superfamily hydrolase